MDEKQSVVSVAPTGGGSATARLVAATADQMLGLRRLQGVYDRRPEGCTGFDFMEWVLDALGVRYETNIADLRRLPERGPLIVVANHPYGGVEGMVLGCLLRSLRPDVKILANYFLGRIPELRESFFLVDPFETPRAVRANLPVLRQALDWVRDGGALALFPAGEVSHLRLSRRVVEDPRWLPTVAGLVRRTGSPVAPVFFSGRNGTAFQLLGLLHPRLRTAMLPRELLARRGQTIEARFGSLIPNRQLTGYADDVEMVAYLRSRTYIMSARPSLAAGPVQPRSTPSAATPVVAGHPPEVLADEIGRLPADQLLVDGEDQVVYVATAPQIPSVLHEIGRLRELSFREVGEGTGREIDLDIFDPEYRHLFIWSRKAQEVVGAYRLGLTDTLIGAAGIDGLYTSTLFDFKPKLFERMGPALEMGRSFIRPEYQKSYAGLMLLWKGIGRFVIRHPAYATLFGPVSISADYQSASQRLIVAFLEQNKYAHEWSRWVRPRESTRVEGASSLRLGPAQLRNLEDVSSFIAEIEADHKGVPILLKQYLKLGGRLLGFNVDPRFSNVLDVLIMVDLRQTAPKILARYMGREGAAGFLASHKSSQPQAS